jgi:hypothetical protein
VSIIEKIKTDAQEALKNQQPAVAGTLRLLLAALQNRQIAARQSVEDISKELSDEEVIAVLKTELKKRQEAIEMYQQGQRPELAAKEQAESEILAGYLPPQLSDEEISKVIEEKVAASGLSGPAAFGKVMPLVMAALQGRADGSKVSQLLRERLTKN